MSFRHKLIGKINFGTEVNDILRLNGIENTYKFICPSEEDVEDLSVLDNLELAASVILEECYQDKKIGILVDCDADGYTSASILWNYLHKGFPKIKMIPFIHSGKQHGLTDKEAFEQIKSYNLDLLIIPDASTGDVYEINELLDNGTMVIVLDHHDIIPNKNGIENRAIIVNNQLSEKCNDKSMTGVGIVYKLLQQMDILLNEHTEKQWTADDYLDLVAIGMIADRCDLTNLQSRYLVLKGIKQLKEKKNHNMFLKHIIEKQAFVMKNNVTITSLAYYVCPLINAMIRLGEFDQKMDIFFAMCNEDAMRMRKVRGKGEVVIPLYEDVYKNCMTLNKTQKTITEESFDVLKMQIDDFKLDELPVIICNSNNYFDKNFTGLIANVVASSYKRPCLLLNPNDNMLHGSARGFNKSQIYDFKKWCKGTELFSKTEGHSNAFGVSISMENIQKLIDKLARVKYDNELIYYVYNEYDDTTINSDIINRIHKYNHIWNNGIDEPLFYVSNICCNFNNIEIKGKKNNILSFPYRNMMFTYMSKSSLLELYNDIKKCGDNIRFDMICRFSYDDYNKKSQCIIEDIMFSEDKNKMSNPFGCLQTIK